MVSDQDVNVASLWALYKVSINIARLATGYWLLPLIFISPPPFLSPLLPSFPFLLPSLPFGGVNLGCALSYTLSYTLSLPFSLAF